MSMKAKCCFPFQEDTIAGPSIWVNPFNQPAAIQYVNIFVLPAA